MLKILSLHTVHFINNCSKTYYNLTRRNYYDHKKIGIIGCGNMGGAILYGALESGVLNKENVYVYDINPAMMEKAKGWGVNLAENDEDVCKKSEIILLAVKPQNASEAMAQCQKALDEKALMSIVAGVTVERLQNMIDGTPRILRLLPNTPALVPQR